MGPVQVPDDPLFISQSRNPDFVFRLAVEAGHDFFCPALAPVGYEIVAQPKGHAALDAEIVWRVFFRQDLSSP